jgi:hypothetical protein
VDPTCVEREGEREDLNVSRADIILTWSITGPSQRSMVSQELK